ncbi:MAG: dockerin type I domain-containing protein, partial [Candidatus Omnitrophota bacterium]
MSDPPTPAFRVIDTDGNQTITADEAVAAYLGYRKGFGQQGTNLLYDVNGDGSVSEADLALLASAVTQETMPYWKAAILLDANQDGDVTVREVQAAVSAWQAEWGQSGAALRYDVNGDGKSDEPDLTIIQTAVPEILDSAGRVVYQALPDGLYAIYSYDPTGLAEKNILGVLTRVSGSQESDHYKNTSFLNKGDSPQNGEVVI